MNRGRKLSTATTSSGRIKLFSKVVATAAVVGLIFTSTFGSKAIANDTPAHIEVIINGMVCSFCVQGIERKLKGLPAAQNVKVDIQKQVVNITVRPGGSITDQQLRKLIRDAGFDVRKIKRSSEA